MTTVRPDLDLCVPEWMLLILWLIITPEVKGHILDANEKGDFLKRCCSCSDAMTCSFQAGWIPSSAWAPDGRWSNLACVWHYWRWALASVCRTPCSPLPSPLRQGNKSLPTIDFFKWLWGKKYIHICFACEFKICRRKAEEKNFILVCCILIFSKCWLKYAPK